jgi:hypothetical protein
MKKEYEYKAVRKGSRTTDKTLIYWVNQQGLQGWKLLTRAFPNTPFTVFHFRRKLK